MGGGAGWRDVTGRGGVHGIEIPHGWLRLEVSRRKGGRWRIERAETLKRMTGERRMMLLGEVVHIDDGTDMGIGLRGRHRQGRAQAERHAGRMEVTGLTVEPRMLTAGRRRCIITRWLIHQRRKGERVGIEQGRGEAPRVLVAPRGGIVIVRMILELVMLGDGRRPAVDRWPGSVSRSRESQSRGGERMSA